MNPPLCPCQVPGYVGDCSRTECLVRGLTEEVERLRRHAKSSHEAADGFRAIIGTALKLAEDVQFGPHHEMSIAIPAIIATLRTTSPQPRECWCSVVHEGPCPDDRCPHGKGPGDDICRKCYPAPDRSDDHE